MMAVFITGPTQWLNDLASERSLQDAQPQIDEVESLRQNTLNTAQLPAASPVDGSPSFGASVQLGQSVDWISGQPQVQQPQQQPVQPRTNWFTGQEQQPWQMPSHVPTQGFENALGSWEQWAGPQAQPPQQPKVTPIPGQSWSSGPRSGASASQARTLSASGPIDPSTLGPIAEGDPEAFYASALPYAQIVEQETGVPAALTLAIAANETGYGQRRYMAGDNNYHGIQDSTGTGTPYVDWRPGPNGERIPYEARQAGYASPLEGFRAFGRFLTENPRYGEALASYRNTGDLDQLVAGIHRAGYAEDPAYTDKITSLIHGIPIPTGVGSVVDQNARPISERVGAPVGIADGADWRQRWSEGLTPNQIDETLNLGMDMDAAVATCGPAGALALLRATGGNMTFGQVLELAQNMKEWNADVGMVNGYQGQLRLLKQLGVDAEARPINEQEMVQTLQNGQPVQINATGNGGHYYTAIDYDPQTGKFNWGNSARILKRANGQTWFRLDELPALGVGTPSNAIYITGAVR